MLVAVVRLPFEPSSWDRWHAHVSPNGDALMAMVQDDGADLTPADGSAPPLKEMWMVVGFEVMPCSIKREAGQPVQHVRCKPVGMDKNPPPAQEISEGQDIVYTYDVYFDESPIVWASRCAPPPLPAQSRPFLLCVRPFGRAACLPCMARGGVDSTWSVMSLMRAHERGRVYACWGPPVFLWALCSLPPCCLGRSREHRQARCRGAL